ncbi:MAG: hypothetical protein C0408_00410 [Odoribacter sp.]|nr:hypothetical protein [Odoribacter sp.]
MKKMKYILILGFAILITASPAFTQEKEVAPAKDFKFTLKTNPLSALGGPLFVLWVVPITAEYKLYFETRTVGNQSAQIGLGYLGSSPLIASMEDLGGDTTIGSSGFRAQLWYKFFLTGDKAPAGFYIGPHFSYATAKLKNNKIPDEFFKATKLNINVAFGYQIITKGGFALDIFTGIGLKNKTFDTSNLLTNQMFDEWNLDNKTTIGVPFGFSFGYAF